MALENILSQEIVQKLGWTLLHFIWQAAAVALLFTILLAVLRKSSANLRYIIACAALGLIVLLPMVTMQLVPVSVPQPIANIEPRPAPVIVPVQPNEDIPLARVVEYEEPAQPESVSPAPAVPWKQRAAERLEPALPYIVSIWLLGVLGLSLWHLGGWAQLQRLRKKMVKQVDDSLHTKLRRLSERLRVKRAVQLMESALVQVPTVVGWLRPVILLPASALTGLSSEQLEALLAHELAHIRRYDYLFNMLQAVVETLGFYHPAVWWVSHKIRIERENCCDDLAVSISGDRIRYARALTSMEEIRGRHGGLAVAAAGGNLISRIRRLIGKDSTEKTFSWIPAVTVILLLVALIIPTTLALSTNEKYPTAEFITNKSENGQPENEPPNAEKIDLRTKVLIETQIIHVNNDFLEQVGLDANSLKNSNSWMKYRIDDSRNPSMFVIDSHSKKTLLKNIYESQDTSSTSRIFTMSMSGREVTIKNGTGYKFKSQELGRFIKIKPELSQDGQSTYLDCELMMRQFKSPNLFFDVYINKKVDQNDVSESEIVEFQTNAGNILLPDDHTLLILSGKLVSLRDVENGTPILRNIPVIGELFNTTSKVKVEKNEIILIKTTIFPAGQSDDIDSKASSYNVAKIGGYKTSELLRIYLDLHLEVGQYVEIKDNSQRESKLKQVDTGDIGKSSKDFPAYASYIDFEIRSNFDLYLATKRYTRGSFFEHDKWDAYFTGPDTIIGNGHFSPTTLCVSTWRVKLYEMGRADDDIIASLVAVIIKPNNKQQEKSDVEVETDEGRIEGRIIDINTGKGIPGVQLAAVPDSSPASNERFACTSAEDGSFAIGGLQSGEYLLQGDFPSVDVDVVSGRCTNDVLIGVDRRKAVPAPKETTAEQQGDVQIIMGMRVIEMPAVVMKDVFEPNESLSSGLLVRHGHEIAGRLLTLRQEREDVKQMMNPQILMMNNENSAMILANEEKVYTGGYESAEGEPGKLTAQPKILEAGWKYNIKAEILEGGEKVHIELAARQQKPVFETLQYRPGYDYQIPSPPEIFVTEVTAKNGEPVVISRLRRDEPAFCLIVTASVLVPERQPEPLLGKKLPEPENIQNIDSLKQAEGKRILVCFWDMNQRPSRNIIIEIGKRAKELAEKNIAVHLVHTSKIDPAKLKEWLDGRNIPSACENIESDAGKVLFRWGVRAQPWLILTDEEGIVRTEGFNIEQLNEKLRANGTNDVLSKAEGANVTGNFRPDESADKPQEKTDTQRKAEVFGRVLQDGRNVVGATVIARIRSDQLSKSSSRPPALFTRTDENGFYRFADLPAGRYSISVMSPKGNLNMAQKQINLEPGYRTELNFGDEEGFTLSGVVTVDGEAVEIASVWIQLPNESIKWDWTDRDGKFRITGIPSGRYRLFTTYDKDLDPVTFVWGKDGKQDYDTRFDRRQITIENDLSVDIRLEDRSKKDNPAGTSKLTAAKARIVQIDLSVVEVFSDSKMDRETTVEIKNLLGGKITIPDSPDVADLLRKAAGATAAVKDESAGDKRVTNLQFKTLFDILVSRGFVKIMMNPTLEVVESQTAKVISTEDSIEDSIQITPTVRKDGNIILQTNLALSLKSAGRDANQLPSIRRWKISTGASISPGQSWIVEGMKAAEKSSGAQEQKSELLVILTPAIVPPAEPKEPMETVNFQNVPAGTVIEKLAAWTGKTIIPPADLLKQKITIYSPEQMPRSEAAAMILNSLRSKGYTAEQSDETILLKPAKEEQPGTGKAQIMIDTKVLTVSDEFMKYIGLDPNSVASSKGWLDHLIHSSDDSASFVIDQLHADSILKAVAARMRTHKDIQMLVKPQVFAMAGKKVEIHILKPDSYMLRSPSEPNALSGEPESKSNRIELGTTVRLTPKLTPDGENVELDFEWESRRLRGFKEHTGPDKQTQKVPQIAVDRIKTPCTVPDGRTLLIAGKKITEQKKTEPKKPRLVDLPLIGWLFNSPPQVEETRNLLILVKPSINPQIKAPPKPQPLDPNDPLIKQLEEKFKRSDEQK